MLDGVLQNRLLDSFPNSKSLGAVYQYNTGESGSPVFAVPYEPKNKYGLDGTFIVKIGPKDWAEKEQEFSDNLSDNDPASLLMKCHMHTPALEGQSAVAYEIAFGKLLKPKTLMNILDEGEDSEEEAQLQIKKLAHTLVDWYLQKKQRLVSDPHALLCHMLTEKRTGDLLERVTKALPFWKREVSHMMVDGHSRSLPNPLAYKQVCEKVSHKLLAPTTRIHGDLHTGNVICFLKSENTPKLIDFDQSVPDGIPFFDLAYLEFDIMRHLLPVEEGKYRKEWLVLLDASMTGIQQAPSISSWGASRTRPFLEAIRQEVARLVASGSDIYEAVWWLSTVAVGLNFARKGDETRSPFERIAGLLYAAYGLDQFLKILNVQKLPMKGSPCIVSWVEGNFLLQNSPEPSPLPPSPNDLSEPLPRDTTLPLPLSSTLARADEALPLVYPSLSPKVNSVLTHVPAQEISGEHSSTSIVEVATQEDRQIEEGRLKRSTYFSATVAKELQGLLQETISLFQAGGYIFKDVCDTTSEMLQRFGSFFQETLQNIPDEEYFIRFLLDNLADQQKKLNVDVRSFREGCPSAPARKLSEKRYDKERAAVCTKLENFQTKFLELSEKTL